MAQDALTVLDTLKIGTASFCGLSLGGMVGQWLGAHASDRFDHLVLANTTPYAGPDIWGPRVLAARRDGMANLVEPTLARWFTDDFRDRDASAVAQVRAVLSTTPPEGYAGSAAAIRDMDQRSTSGAIKPPTLVIFGEKDVATPPSHARDLAGAIPDSRLTALDGAHLSNIEQADAFNRAVSEFLHGPA